ncbi:MAG TPA: LamG-like jellyroll fold domain-containing protein, partial [Cyclobacteriaceae bacterium]|nr:LamG-like jellyroll fold domain-containing protein [Cyclobacteriaceae bacterium]
MKRFLLAFLWAALSVTSHAQTGPGGVGNTLGVGQPRNVLWLDATKLPLTDGNDITAWPDLSGNANNLSAAAAISPQFENTTPINGLGYARFSKADNRILLTNFNDMPQSAYTAVIVYRTNGTGQGLVSYAASDASPDEYALRNSDALRTYIGSGAFDQSTLATNNNAFRVVINSWDNIDGILDYYIDGNESGGSYRTVNGFKIGQNIQPGGTFVIGNDQDLLNDGYEAADAFSGDIAEVIVYDRKLNAAQVRIVNNYINAKYGFAITGDNYAGDTPANGNYDFAVAGIGRHNGTTHNEANSAGFILTGISYSGTTSKFVIAGHNNLTNTSATVVSSGFGTGGAVQRWNRSWFVDFSGTVTVTADLTFDLGEGINGGSPVNADNYVLLKYNTVTSLWDVSSLPTTKTINGDRISFRIASANASNDDGRYTLGTLDAVASPVAGINIRTWYSYQTGQWNNPDVWTLDGGVVPLLTNPGNEIPQPGDNVIITNGRTITMNVNAVTLAGIQVDGTLNVAATSGHNFNSIRGNGRIRLSGAAGLDNFPAGTTTLFADATTGGTVEYYGSSNISLNQNRTFNNVEVKL